jgi:hypothetical protein
MNLGIVKISDTLMHDLRLNKSTDIFAVLYSKFFPCAMYYNQFDRNYEVLGFCSDFKEVKEGEVYPEYDATFTQNEDKKITVEFKKQ